MQWPFAIEKTKIENRVRVQLSWPHSVLGAKMIIDRAVNSILLKVFFGTVLSAVMIVSFINLAQELPFYLDRFENSDSLESCIFAVFFLSAGSGLIFMFKSEGRVRIGVGERPTVNSLLGNIDFSKLKIRFLEGFISEVLGKLESKAINGSNKKANERN